jgi:hypothetical protein
MPLQPLDPGQFWEVHVDWKKPVKYKVILEAGCNHDDSAHLYRILSRYSVYPFKSLYIGHTYNQCISVRLGQPDHKKRYADFQVAYPKHSFWVSCGIVTMENGKKTKKRIKDIETILIYTNQSEHSHNVSNVYKHGVTGSYHIENHGYRCGLPRELHLGFFVR